MRMIKRMATCSVNEGIDPDEFWDYHHSVHAQDILRHGGEREFYKYSMSRVTEIFRGIPGFYDITEYWYEDQKAVDSLNQMWKEALASSGKDVASDFDSRVKENCSFIVEQVVVKDDSPRIPSGLEMNNLYKLAVAWNTSMLSAAYPK
jgi:hypothetical protein